MNMKTFGDLEIGREFETRGGAECQKIDPGNMEVHFEYQKVERLYWNAIEISTNRKFYFEDDMPVNVD